jgi:hypothetical protein
MSSDEPTNPNNLKPTLEDLISSLVGCLQRVEVQIAELQSSPPKWMQEWMQQITQRVEKLEGNCNRNHDRFFHKNITTF